MVKFKTPGGKYHLTFLVNKSPGETVRRLICTHQRVDELLSGHNPGRLVYGGSVPVEARCRRCWR